MDHIGKQLIKRFAQKKIDKQIAGTLALHALASYTSLDHVDGYVRHHILFVKTNDRALQIRLFREQSDVLAYINSHLHTMGYDYQIHSLRFR